MLPIQNLPPLQLNPTTSNKSEVSELTNTFGEILDSMVQETGMKQEDADKAIAQLHAGGEKNLHEVMIAMEQADISLRYLVQIRNKALEAYQEISRLQL